MFRHIWKTSAAHVVLVDLSVRQLFQFPQLATKPQLNLYLSVAAHFPVAALKCLWLGAAMRENMFINKFVFHSNKSWVNE